MDVWFGHVLHSISLHKQLEANLKWKCRFLYIYKKSNKKLFMPIVCLTFRWYRWKVREPHQKNQNNEFWSVCPALCQQKMFTVKVLRALNPGQAASLIAVSIPLISCLGRRVRDDLPRTLRRINQPGSPDAWTPTTSVWAALGALTAP